MAEEETAQPVDDPLDTIADAVSTAAEGDQDKPIGSQKATTKAIFSGGALLSRTVVYSTCYYVSYGVVFGSLMLASAVPMDNAMGAGLRDGTDAARDVVQKRIAARAARLSAQLENEDVAALIDSLAEEEGGDADTIEE